MATRPSQPEPVPIRSSAPTGRARPSRKWLRLTIGAGIAAALVVALVLWWGHQRNAITYETVPVERGSIQARVTMTGTLNAVVNVLVSSQVSGNIKALYADWNSKVKKGQLVALIDPEIFQAQVEQAGATFRSARAGTITAQAQVEMAKANLTAAIANEKNAEAVRAKDLANAVNAKGLLERYTQANIVSERRSGGKAVPQQEVDTAKASYDAAEAQLAADAAQIDAANQSIQSARAAIQVAESQLNGAQAQEHQARAALEQAQINLDRCKIYAPVDGTVIARRMDVGQTVASTLNPPTIFEIAQDLTKMQVDTNVDESDIGSIRDGQNATFTVDAYPGATFHGLVAEIRKAPIITQNVVTYDVVIHVDNSDLKLFPGMTTNVTILTARADDTLKVPNSVLRFRPSAVVLKATGLSSPPPDRQWVYRLANGKLEAVSVKFGLSDGAYTAVTSDRLEPGAQLVIRAAAGTGSNTSTTTGAPMAPRM